MANWLIRAGAASTDVRPESNDLIIRLRRNLSIKSGDRLVLLFPKDDKPAFTHRTTVKDVEKLRDEEDVQVFRVRVDNWQPLVHPSDRDDLRYSLTIVRNIQKPYLHFRQGYRRLPEWDFISIVEGRPFLARTAFLEILLALPEALRSEFYVANRFDLPFIESTIPFATRLLKLVQFVDTRVFAVGNQLIEASDDWEKILGRDNVSAESAETYFADDDENSRPNSIRVQAEIFRELQAQMRFPIGDATIPEGQSLFSLLVREASEGENINVERRFERIFRARA